MEKRFERFVLASSAVLLVAAAFPIALGFLATGPSLPVAGGLGLVAVAAVALRRVETTDSLATYLDWLWVGPAVAALVVVAGIAQGWSPGELQAVGGIVGMVGVVNLFLRPVYRLLSYVAEILVRIGREIQEEGS